MKGDPKSASDIAKQIEAFFGERVINMTAPGGKQRGSYRVNFKTWSMIVSSRKNLGRTNLEARVLEQLQDHTDCSAGFLGLDDNLLFQADVGNERLSQKIQTLGATEREDLADKAVAALFDIQSAARKTPLKSELPQLGASMEWVEAFVNGIGDLSRTLRVDPVAYDSLSICEFIGTPAVEFVKWDCRSGNAAIDDAGVVRWFDFEYSGIRHGAEDFAWLIADEIWPVGPETMIRIVKDHFDQRLGRRWDDYRSYLEVYSTLHAIQRLLQIVNIARESGWISERKAVQHDEVGANPRIAIRLCQTTRYLAERNVITEPVAKLAIAAEAEFRKTLG